MPSGEKDQVDQNPNMTVNVKGATNLIDFVLVQDRHITMANGKNRGMSLPTEEEFTTIINTAINNMLHINLEWCNVVKRYNI